MKPLVGPLIVVLALATAGFAWLAWHEYGELAALRAEGVAPDERARLQKVAWDAERTIRELRARLGAERSARASASATEPTDSLSLQARTLAAAAEDWFSRMDDPEIQKLRDAQRMALIRREYASFFESARLTPAQIQQFERLMLERWDAQNDVLAAATQQGINPMQDPREFQQMVRDAQNQVDQQLQAGLGAATYGQYQAYQRAQGQRTVVAQLQQDLDFTSAPLSEAQAQQMATVMAETNPKGGGNVSDQTVALARGVLSPPQVQALQNLQQVQQANRALQQAITRAQAAGTPPPGG